MFVAGFIGSPQMNFITVKVERRGEDLFLVFADNEIRLPEGKMRKFEGTDYIGRDVVMGIRPENLHDEDVYMHSMSDSVVDARVEIVEMLGSETLLHMMIGDVEFTAKVNPRSKARAGDIVKIAFDTNKIHLFDRETERVIMN
jgi:multiple sugar transport system ATP-binding protein